MAKKKSLRDRALDALGDFSGLASEETVRAKMDELQRMDAESAAAAVDDVLKDPDKTAAGYERMKGQEKPKSGRPRISAEKEAEIAEAAHEFAAVYASMKAARRDTASHDDAPKENDVGKPAEEAAKTPQKKKRGRPRKHESGGQLSVWFDDDLKREIENIAARLGCSFSDAVNKMLVFAIKNRF